MLSLYGLPVLASAVLAWDQVFPFNPGFDIRAVTALAESLPSHSWEFGTAAEASLELYNASLSVFSPCNHDSDPVSPIKAPITTVRALRYADEKIVIGSGANALSDGDGAVGDPASLGVSALLLGQTIPKYADAAREQLDFVVNEAPRWSNGAISHRVEEPELWADFIYMAPPFIAYYGLDKSDASLIKEAVEQCKLYREVLLSQYPKLWKHIVGNIHPDAGIWSTGNAWAAAGMTRVLATVLRAPSSLVSSSQKRTWTDELTSMIKEIIDGALISPDDNGLLRNYLDDTTWFGEISGSSLIAAVVYRMAVLQPKVFGYHPYLEWADATRETLGEGHVTSEGIARPAVNPLGWGDREPFVTGSPEGQNFVVLMYAAWRDCVLQRVCRFDWSSVGKNAQDIQNSARKC
ncbi:hypothetical protein WG66_011933 [Moniliophthora roreri]|uniref:Six-hairpin glycosidase n=1 Tax=Moniliophthora roreri TaxID=221103 RepID=A0A0W0FLW0_MONRR|nr:hypothetical protein WG66_011933 [Moniliophthora roreri]